MGKYTPEEERKACQALVITGGKAKQAREILQSQGISIPEGTLRTFKRTRASLYAQVMEEDYPKLRQLMAADQDELMAAYTQAEWEALAKARELIPAIKSPTDAANVLRSIAVPKGIAGTKARELRDLPTIIKHESSDPSNALDWLKRKGVIVEPENVEVVSEPVPPTESQAQIPAGKDTKASATKA